MDLRVMRIEIAGLQPELPRYASAGAAGLDLEAAEDATIKPGARALVRLGLRVEIPDGYEGQIRSRSGLALEKGVICLNSPGTIDADYRGELTVLLANLGESSFVVRAGDRIAQLIVAPIERVNVVEVEELSTTVRGTGGFGSSGV